MDKKPDDSQKRTLYHDDYAFFCPVCETLEEHRNKNCPETSLVLTKDTNDIVDLDTHENDLKKRPCYRCDDCNLSFTNSHNLEDHRDKHCRKKQIMMHASEVASYQSCMDGLKAAIENEKSSFDSFRKARSKTMDTVKHYKAVKMRKECAEKFYMDAVIRKMKLCTIASVEEQLIVSDIAARASNELKNALKEEGLAIIAMNQALHKLKKANNIATFSSNKVQFAFSEVFKLFQEKPVPALSSPEVLNQKLLHFRTALSQSCNILVELQKGAEELEASVSAMIGVNPKKDELGIIENAGLIPGRVNERGGDPSIDPPEEKLLVDVVQLDEMDMTAENMDSNRPSTSGTH